MVLKKRFQKILIIGSLFILTGLDYVLLLSSKDPDIAGYWKNEVIGSFSFQTAFADRKKSEDDDHRTSSKSSGSNPVASPTPTASTNTSSSASGSSSSPSPTSPTTPASSPTPTSPSAAATNTTTSASGASTIAKPSASSPAPTSTSASPSATSGASTTAHTTAPASTPSNTAASSTAKNTTSGASGAAATTPTPANNATKTTTATWLTTDKPTVKTSQPIPANSLKDGTFTGQGYYSFPGGSIAYEVQITVSGGKITAAKWLKFTESGNGKYTRAAGDALLKKVVSSQTNAVNTISGATGTSNATYDAIAEAIAKAKGTTAQKISAPASASKKSTNVEVKTSSPTSTSGTGERKTSTGGQPSNGNGAKDDSEEPISKESLQINEKKPDPKKTRFRDGNYDGEGTYVFPGGSRSVSVEIRVEGGKITAADWVKFGISADSAYTKKQADLSLQKLKQDQSPSIDTVTGATGESQAAFEAMNNAVLQASVGASIEQSKEDALEKKLIPILTKLDESNESDAFKRKLKELTYLLANKAESAVTDSQKAAYAHICSTLLTTMKEIEGSRYTTLEGKTYDIIHLPNGKYSFKTEKGGSNAEGFDSFFSLKSYLDSKSDSIIEDTHITPNGRIFSLVLNRSSESYGYRTFSRKDGPLTFFSKKMLIAYLDTENAVTAGDPLGIGQAGEEDTPIASSPKPVTSTSKTSSAPKKPAAQKKTPAAKAPEASPQPSTTSKAS